MRLLILVLLTTFASSAMAGDTFSLVPGSVSAGEEVRLRIDSSSGCFLAVGHAVTRNGAQLEVRVAVGDTLPCQPQQMTPIFLSLGSFPAGAYEVTVTLCGMAPTCSVPAVLPLSVSTSGAVTIPAMSYIGATLIALAMLLSGIFLRRNAT